jgi:hypothetical protein
MLQTLVLLGCFEYGDQVVEGFGGSTVWRLKLRGGFQ